MVRNSEVLAAAVMGGTRTDLTRRCSASPLQAMSLHQERTARYVLSGHDGIQGRGDEAVE